MKHERPARVKVPKFSDWYETHAKCVKRANELQLINFRTQIEGNVSGGYQVVSWAKPERKREKYSREDKITFALSSI